MTVAVRHVRPLAVAAALVVIPLGAGCAAGQGDETASERTTPYAANADVGSIKLRDVEVVPVIGSTDTGATASSTSSATPSPGAASGYLAVVLVNSGGAPDTLVGVSVPGATVTPSDTGAALTVTRSRPLTIGDPEQGATGPTLTLDTAGTPLRVGTVVPVTFTFANAGQVTVQAPVRTSY